MTCTTCGNTCGQNCGCESGLVTPPSCGSQNCPDPNPCSETFDSQCIIYTGAPIKCGNDTVVATNNTVAEALESVVDYFCSTPAPASCICLYEAKVRLTTEDIHDGTAKLVPGIVLGDNEAIEVVSASFKYTFVNNFYNLPISGSNFELIIDPYDQEYNYDPQFYQSAKILQNAIGPGDFILLMNDYPLGSETSSTNMALGKNLYARISKKPIDSQGDGYVDFTILYKKTTY